MVKGRQQSKCVCAGEGRTGRIVKDGHAAQQRGRQIVECVQEYVKWTLGAWTPLQVVRITQALHIFKKFRGRGQCVESTPQTSAQREILLAYNVSEACIYWLTLLGSCCSHDQSMHNFMRRLITAASFRGTVR